MYFRRTVVDKLLNTTCAVHICELWWIHIMGTKGLFTLVGQRCVSETTFLHINKITSNAIHFTWYSPFAEIGFCRVVVSHQLPTYTSTYSRMFSAFIFVVFNYYYITRQWLFLCLTRLLLFILFIVWCIRILNIYCIFVFTSTFCVSERL